MTESSAIALSRGFPLSSVWSLFLLTIRRLTRPRRLLILIALYLLPIALVVLIQHSVPTNAPQFPDRIETVIIFILLPHTLFLLTIRRLTRPRCLFILIALYLLPIALVVLIQHSVPTNAPQFPDRIETVIIFILLPHTLLPLSALLATSGLIQDEVEEQTLTYLLLRPIPRAWIYIAKFLASIVVTGAIASFFAIATETAIFRGQDDAWTTLLQRVPTIIGLYLLAVSTYSAIFGCLGVFFRRALLIGIVYIISVEGIFGNIDFIVRKLTVMYYFRVLAVRWLDPIGVYEWSINLDDAPRASSCILILLSALVALTLLAGLVFRAREFRLKTPEAT